jgi:type IV pilus assembly protein PilV
MTQNFNAKEVSPIPRGSWVQCSRLNGFTLIEVLVSIVILSLGVLGVVGLQAAAIQSNREARNQMVALQLARELADMVRGNHAVGALTVNNPYMGSFSASCSANPASGGTSNCPTKLTPEFPSYCLTVGSTCASATSLAQAQLTQWLAHVDSVLPSARVVTCFDDDPYGSGGLPVWTCPQTAPTGAPFVIKIGWTRSVLDKSKTGAAALEMADNAGSSPSIVLPFSP